MPQIAVCQLHFVSRFFSQLERHVTYFLWLVGPIRQVAGFLLRLVYSSTPTGMRTHKLKLHFFRKHIVEFMLDGK